MFFIFRLMAVFIMVFSLSCGTVEKSGVAEGNQKNQPDKMLSKSAPRPEWTNWLAKKQQGDSFYFVGESSEVGSKKSAHAMAFADALAKVSISFGLTVSSTISDIRKERDGKQSYDIGITNKLTGSPIKIKQFTIAAKYHEKWRRDGKIRYDAKALIAVPIAEMKRINKEINGLVGWGVLIKNDSHTPMLRDALRAVAQQKKIIINGDRVDLLADYSMHNLQKQLDVAYFLLAKVDYEEPVQESGAWYTRVKLTISMVSLVDGNEKWSLVEEVKSGEYSKDGAVKLGIKKAITIIIDNL